MSIFDQMLADSMAAVCESCLYTPVDGSPAFTIQIAPAAQDRLNEYQGNTSIRQEGATFEVRTAALPTPKKGDRLFYGGKTLVVKSFRHPENDADRIIWLLDTAKL